MLTRFAAIFRSPLFFGTLFMLASIGFYPVSASASVTDKTSQASKAADLAPPPSPFDRKWSKIISASKADASACKKYLKEEAGLDGLLNKTTSGPKPKSAQAATDSTAASPATTAAPVTNETPSPTEKRLLSEGKILKDWPGYPPTTVKAFKMILSHAFPPTQMNAKNFIKSFHALDTCHLQSSLFLAAKDIEAHLSTDSAGISSTAQTKLVSDLKSFLHKVAAKPGPLAKLIQAVKITRKLGENNLDPKFSRKYGVIVSVDREAKKLSDKLAIDSTPGSVMTIWQRVHDSEQIRMELAQILFFP